MEIGSGAAPGKVILFGEHAVVYGRPALAVPVTEVCATATVRMGLPGAGLIVEARDLGQQVRLDQAGNPLAEAAGLALRWLDLEEPDWRVEVRSTIPIASGLGSGAAVSVALMRALAAAAGRELPPGDASVLAFEVERLHHGTPSGVDNTVVAYGQPVYFVRGQPPEPFAIGHPFLLAIGDTGIASPTRVTVGDVRAAWQQEPERYEALFDRIGAIVDAAREAISAGTPEALGPLMDANHALLQEIGVSSPELDSLVAAARSAGAEGAKLCGGGRGGNMIALVTRETADAVADALRRGGRGARDRYGDSVATEVTEGAEVLWRATERSRVSATPLSRSVTSVAKGNAMDLREFLAAADEAGYLLRYEGEADPYLEIARLALAKDGRPVLFDRVRGSAFRVVAGVCSDRRYFGLALGAPPDQVVFRLAAALEHPEPPPLVASGPCREVVMPQVDLEQIPFLTHYPEDGGAYASSAVVFINDPETGPQRLVSPAAASRQGPDGGPARRAARHGNVVAELCERHPRWNLYRPAASRAARSFDVGADRAGRDVRGPGARAHADDRAG